ncbi:hypothetical protein H6788_02535 [Candidatus Nomurabacteria bacterium]|nr:hypothetical protein [Candidatus Nomurabacteria bacterium]
MTPHVKPLSYRHRYWFFYLLTGIFVAALPFLFLYASGYRFELGESGLVSTGGLYIAAEKTGAQIFINDELVRETRVFRRAFYAQGFPEGTHKVHVDKPGHHTWVKELPVYSHLVTEAQAFNLPKIPKVKIITPWRTPAGVNVVTASSTLQDKVTFVNQYLLEPRANSATMVANSEFETLLELFTATTTEETSSGLVERMRTTLTSATSTESVATTTKEWSGVMLFEDKGDVYARFVGTPSNMPYYYCAAPFPRYEPKATSTKTASGVVKVAEAMELDDELSLEVQTVDNLEGCDPTIKMDRKGEKVSYFDFFPNSTDLVIMGSESGIYVIEIDDRAWQNRQPLISGKELEVRVYGGAIYVYDGSYIYQIQINQDWL